MLIVFSRNSKNVHLGGFIFVYQLDCESALRLDILFDSILRHGRVIFWENGTPL